jgi:hypothetical protein
MAAGICPIVTNRSILPPGAVANQVPVTKIHIVVVDS